MSQPVNKKNYNKLTNTQLFAHNHMQRETKRIDPYGVSTGTGVLGRMADVLTREGVNVDSFSIDRFSVTLRGRPAQSDPPMIVGRHGLPRINLGSDIKNALPILHNITSFDSGVFSDTWSAALIDSIGTNDLLRSEIEGATTQVQFPNSYLGNMLATVSRFISTREARGSTTDTFYIEIFGKFNLILFFVSVSISVFNTPK